MDLKIKRNATLADWEAVPAGQTPQLIDGVLYITGRPNIPHANAMTYLIQWMSPFSRDRAKEWIILTEAAVRFGKNMLVPDITGWRRERLGELPTSTWIDTAPDFVCEGLSPSTARLDRGRKREIYAKAKVGHYWFIDPAHRTIEVLALAKGIYNVVASAGDDDRAKFPPFDLELNLANLWRW